MITAVVVEGRAPSEVAKAYGLSKSWVCEPVGYGQLVDSVDGVGYLADLFVHPDHRGRGCAQALLAARIELAHSRGFTHVVLSASDEGRRSFVLSGFAVSTWYSFHRRIDSDA